MTSVLLVACQRGMPPQVIATVGDSYVSVEEFEDTYQEIILTGDRSDSPQLRREHARFLARRKLFAVAARHDGLELGTYASRQVEKEVEKALRAAYFEEVITSELEEPEEADLRTHFFWLHTEVDVRHIFSPDKRVIDSIYLIVSRTPERFAELARTTFKSPVLAESGGRLGWVGYNQLDPAFEEAAYRTPVDSISRPVRSAHGWHLIQKLDERIPVILSEQDYELEQPWLRRQVISKRRQIRADRFVNRMMVSKNVNIDEKIFYFVAARIRAALQSRPEHRVARRLTVEEMRGVQIRVTDMRDVVFTTFDGGQWTVADFIQRLDEMPPNLLQHDLVMGFYRLLRDHFLVQEARAAGLEKDPVVRTRQGDAEDLYYGSAFLSRVTGHEFGPGRAVSIRTEKIQQLVDSLGQLYPVEYDFAVIDSLI